MACAEGSRHIAVAGFVSTNRARQNCSRCRAMDSSRDRSRERVKMPATDNAESHGALSANGDSLPAWELRPSQANSHKSLAIAGTAESLVDGSFKPRLIFPG